MPCWPSCSAGYLEGADLAVAWNRASGGLWHLWAAEDAPQGFHLFNTGDAWPEITTRPG
jgi:hypothetical protein